MRVKKIAKIAVDLLLVVLFAVCVSALLLTICAGKDVDGTAEVFGYQLRVIASDSMAACDGTDVSAYRIKSIPLRSMIFVKVMPKDPDEADAWYRSLRVGDVLTFRYTYTTQVTITHRIVSVTEKETGGFLIELAGDNKNSDSGQLSQIIDTSIENSTDYVIGRVAGQCYTAGVIISLLKTAQGIVFVVIVPCLLIILLEVLKIVGIFGAERKKREREREKKRDDELETLRRRLAHQENQKTEVEK